MVSSLNYTRNLGFFVFFALISFFHDHAMAMDTDIYQANVKQNAYVLMDSSGSMDFGVYESNIDYGAMYDYLYVKSGIDDTIASPSFYKNHEKRTKIFLLKGKIGVTIKEIDGEKKVFTGDAADPDYLWYTNDLVDMHVYLDGDGNLVPEAGYSPRLTVDSDGYVLLDGVRLPHSQSRLLHDVSTMYDGSTVDKGFGGMLRAPGYCFSGLKEVGVDAGDHVAVADGDKYIYFFITGNWINMQQMYNLHYTVNPTGDPELGDPAWKYETFPVSADDWSEAVHPVDYPEGAVKYGNKLAEADTEITITHPGATQIQIHFSMFDVLGDGSATKFNEDYVVLYDGSGNQIAKYDADNSPEGNWSPSVPGDTVRVCLKTDKNGTAFGYMIDKYRISYLNGSYLMQNRMDIAKDAMLYVIDEMRGKINWGFATFKYLGTDPDGATIHAALNPNDTDDANRAAIANHVAKVDPMYGTPLGEALQDVFEDGYYGHRNSLDNLNCRKNYVIVVSDGFPSGDDDWSRIGGHTFTDEDKDGFTADPYQYATPPANYYDDVAHWMYTHSWRDKSLVTEPATSYENVISHQIAFGMDHPLLEDAAEEAGGEYITAYNKTQLVNAFYSLAMMIAESVSFTAPVVSVDATNKVQNGDDLYMGQFLPMDASYWLGNLKKFKLGDGSAERPDFWMIYDGGNVPAIDGEGRFLDNTTAFWGDDNDANDSDNYGGPDIQEDGAGEVLTERVIADFNNKKYYERNIKTYVGGNMVDFDRINVSPTDLGLASTDTDIRNKVVNWVYGYTFDAGIATGDPVAPREWALGAIVHSRPTVVDYYNSGDFSKIDKRYIVVGADDGMLHVFDDADGSEVFAFIPSDVLPKLPAYENVFHQFLVDGSVKLYRKDGKPYCLIFGLRRGGGSYWALDVSDSNVGNWKVKWVFSPGEIAQSWSDVEVARIRTGPNTFKDVAVVSGGYDPVEDSFPEPFNDLDNNGTPILANGSINNKEWSSSDSNQDVYNNNAYDIFNPVGDKSGRGIYVVDVETGSVVFSVVNGSVNSPSVPGSASSITGQTRTDFKYCFPATPSVVSLSSEYSYDVAGTNYFARENNVLAAIYASDIYGNVFRVTYDYAGGKKTWQVKHLFSANPGSASASGKIWGGDNLPDRGRKVFYGPAVSWLGSGAFFDPSNYFYPNTTFYGTRYIASIFFGTGDREHPNYNVVKDRVYAVYDDTPITTSASIPVSSAPYNEDDLLNITCDELGVDTSRVGLTAYQTVLYKNSLKTLLTDDVLNLTTSDKIEQNGTSENDAKGWYIILEKQGDKDYCDQCSYLASIDSSVGGEDYHFGEKVLSKLTLFAGNLYFTSYQPAYDDPCSPQGNGFVYALNYLNGAAALNLNYDNDDYSGKSPEKKDVTDRYGKHSGVKGIPSGFEIVVRNGQAAAMASAGGSIVGGGDGGQYQIPTPDSGLNLNYWIER
jgi:type IV pilus assembly protein PilY1